jgi:large conductance mechanosensitive channel
MKVKVIQEFKEFITKGNAFDLAIGVIVGGAFAPVVNSMVKDMLMPVLSLGLGKADFSNLYLPLTPAGVSAMKEAWEATEQILPLADAQKIGPVLSYGLFINSLVSFVFLMLGVFILVKVVNRLRRPAPSPAPAVPPAPPRSEVLLEEIRDLLKQKE